MTKDTLDFVLAVIIMGSFFIFCSLFVITRTGRTIAVYLMAKPSFWILGFLVITLLPDSLNALTTPPPIGQNVKLIDWFADLTTAPILIGILILMHGPRVVRILKSERLARIK